MTALRSAVLMTATLLVGCARDDAFRPGASSAYGQVFEAAARGDVGAVTAALDRDPALLRAREEDRMTLLLEAAGEGQAAMVALLISRGADPNARTRGGLTALHLAAQNGDVAMLRLLLNRGARPSVLDGRGRTPLDQAVSHGHPDAATFLRSRGAWSTAPR